MLSASRFWIWEGLIAYGHFINFKDSSMFFSTSLHNTNTRALKTTISNGHIKDGESVLRAFCPAALGLRSGRRRFGDLRCAWRRLCTMRGLWRDRRSRKHGVRERRPIWGYRKAVENDLPSRVGSETRPCRFDSGLPWSEFRFCNSVVERAWV